MFLEHPETLLGNLEKSGTSVDQDKEQQWQWAKPSLRRLAQVATPMGLWRSDAKCLTILRENPWKTHGKPNKSSAKNHCPR